MRRDRRKRHLLYVASVLMLLAVCLTGCVIQSQETAADRSAISGPSFAEPSSTAVPRAEESCSHQWEAGVCTLCGEVCPHEEHGQDGICLLCGERQFHCYTDGVCRCGAEPALITDPDLFPREYLVPCEHAGTITEVSYTTHNLILNRGAEREKTFVLYVPYGYDPARKYNVLVLNHGKGDNQHFWLDSDRVFVGYADKVRGRDVVDHLIDDGVIEPLIIVCPTYTGSVLRYDGQQMSGELRLSILPYLAENYSIYAESDGQGGYTYDRDHFAFAASSLGSSIIYAYMLHKDTDIFSYFGCFSGITFSGRQITGWMEESSRKEPIHFLLGTIGGKEAERINDPAVFSYLTENTSAFAGKNNSRFLPIDRSGHGYTAWIVSLYDFLQLAFRWQ